MNPETAEISAADVDECLRQLRRPELVGVDTHRHAFHRIACLLDTFTMAEVRRLAGLPADTDWVELSIDAELAVTPSRSAASRLVTGPLHWRLRAEDRCRALLELRDNGLLTASLASWPAEGSPHSRFLRLVLTSPISVRKLDFDDTVVLRDVLRWLHGSDLVNARLLQEVDQHLDRLQLFRSFQALLAHGFAGRQDELGQLKAFAFPHGSAAVRVVRNFSDDDRILLIYGPGGLGKSTLLARFLMDHCGPHAAEQVPFVYLDIDRHGFSAVHQVRLVIEALRQLNRQASTSNHLVDGAIAELLAVVNETASADAGARRLSQFELAQRFGRAVAQMTEFGNRPLIAVIDTFEEIQRRGIETENAAWSLLASLLQAVPALRIILAGRSPPREQSRCQMLQLRGLDRPASEALIDGYITHHGLQPLDVGERIQLLSICQDNPLTLRLVLRLLHAEPKRSLNLNVGSWVLLQLSDERLQALLHCRVLSHIDDEEIRRLAYPGMAVRRITPEVIEKVLAGPCGITIRDPEHAKSLFHRLKQEVGLVEVDADGSLLHRNDVRAIVLESMDLGSAKQIREINLAAVAFHSQHSSTQSRAEEIYHRLRLEQSTEELDARWQDDVAALLGNVLDELPEASHIYLASRLSYAVDDSLRKRAHQISWERLALQKLQYATPAAGLQLLAERRERLPGSPLWEYEAELARSNSEFLRAVATVDRATRRGGFRPQQLARLQLIGVMANEAMDEYRSARDYVNVLVELSELHNDTLLKVRAATCARRIDRVLYRAHGIEPPAERHPANNPPQLLLRRNGSIDLRRFRQLASRPVMLREVAAEFGLAYPDMLFFALDRLGLPGSGMGEWLETIKREITLANLLEPGNRQRAALWSQLRTVLDEPLELKESWPAPAALIECLSEWIRHDSCGATLHRLLVEGFRSDVHFLIRNDDLAVTAAIRRLRG